MNAPHRQGDLFGVDVEPEDDTSTDSYCSPPEVLAPVHVVGGRPRLDPWTNGYAIAHGWVNAVEAWTLASGRDPDPQIDPRPWPLEADDFAWGNCPYSNPLPYVRRFIVELERAKAWGMLLLKTDNRTQWWREATAPSRTVIMWDGAVNFFHMGVRVKGNNFASSIIVVDFTNTTGRHDALVEAFERPKDAEGKTLPGVAWVYH